MFVKQLSIPFHKSTSRIWDKWVNNFSTQNTSYPPALVFLGTIHAILSEKFHAILSVILQHSRVAEQNRMEL